MPASCPSCLVERQQQTKHQNKNYKTLLLSTFGPPPLLGTCFVIFFSIFRVVFCVELVVTSHTSSMPHQLEGGSSLCPAQTMISCNTTNSKLLEFMAVANHLARPPNYEPTASLIAYQIAFILGCHDNRLSHLDVPGGATGKVPRPPR